MTSPRILVLAAACSLASCSFFKKGEENYDTVDGGGDAAYDTSNPYGVPGDTAGGAIFGTLGVLIGIPLALISKVLWRELGLPLYRDWAEPPGTMNAG